MQERDYQPEAQFRMLPGIEFTRLQIVGSLIHMILLVILNY